MRTVSSGPPGERQAAARRDAAEAVGVEALGYLANDTDLLSRFLALSGADVSDLRSLAGQPGFLSGVLDFLCAHEPDLVAFAQAGDRTPEEVVAARHVLAGDHAGYD